MLLADPRAYEVIRVIGGVVLAALGIGTLRSARTGHRILPATVADTAPRRSRWGAYGAGLGTNLGNPKAGVFAVSMLPQFVTSRGPVFVSSVALGAVWATVTVCWYLLFTYGVGRGRARISAPSVQRGLNTVTGVVLLILGAVVAAGV